MIHRYKITRPEPHVEFEWIDPISDQRWAEACVRLGGQVFHSVEWLAVLQQTYGFQIVALLATEPDVVGGIPLVRLNDPKGERLSCLPFSDYCGPLLRSPSDWQQFGTRLVEQGLPVRIRSRLGSPKLLDVPGLHETGRAHWHTVEIAGSPDEMWAGLGGSARRAVRSAKKGGLRVREGNGMADLRSFYDLHLGVRKRKYRLLAQPFAFFEHIWERFVANGKGRLLVAEEDGHVVAGVLFLEHDDVWYYKFNASLPERAGNRPNDLILWTAIELACQQGARAIDLGLSDWGQDGLIRYKEKYARSTGIITTVSTSTTPPRRAAAWSFALGSITASATHPRVPDSVTERVGSLVYRYFA